MIAYNSVVIFSDDVRASFRFYQDIFGLDIIMDNKEHVAFKCGLSVWNRKMAQSLIFNKTEEITGKGFELCFESDNISEDYEGVKQHGCRIVTELMMQPWGQYVFRISDPDGNIVEVGEKLSAVIKRMRDDGKSDEEISRLTHIDISILDSFS